MNPNDLIADKIEEAIGRMFSDFSTVETGVTEYSLFYNSQKYPAWFIVLFFADKTRLIEGLKNGVCYQMYTYLLDEFEKSPQTSKIERSVSFEFGKRPLQENDIENRFDLLVKKQERLKKEVNQPGIQVCGNCGHDFNEHQLLCNLKEEGSPPTEGWMICPEEDCNCFQTWNANYK